MITVLMATYNGSPFIIKQLDSIRNQSVSADKVIILDDCSTDDTIKIIKAYIKKYSLDSWVVSQNKTNQGHYQTFINLTKLVQEGIVFFSDQDDIWDSHKIETMLPIFDRENVSMVFCKSRLIDENENIISSPDTSDRINTYSLEKLLQIWPSGYQTAYRAEVLGDMINREFYKFPYFQFHDVLFGMLSCVYGDVIEIDSILDSHRLHLNNVTLSSSSKSFHNSLGSRLDYYMKMYNRYDFVAQVACDGENDDVERISKNYYELYTARYNFIKNWNIHSILKLYQLRNYYNGKRAFISDIVYALRLHSVFGMIVSKFRR